MTLTFVGNFDDMVHDFPYGDQVDAGRLETYLADSVLFGDPLLISDGFLVASPILRAELARGNNSLLVSLCKEGYVRVLCNGDSIVDSVKVRAGDGVSKLRATLDDSSAMDPILRPLAEISLAQQDAPGRPRYFHDYPTRDLTKGFAVMVERYLDTPVELLHTSGLSGSTLGSAIEYFQKLIAAEPRAARSQWAKAAVALAGGNPAIELDLMRLGNDAYHTNFLAALTTTFPGDYQLSSRYSVAFSDLYSSSSLDIERVAQFRPMAVPDVEAFKNVRSLVSFANSLRAQAHKRRYRDTVSNFVKGDPDVTVQAMSDAQREYAYFLSDHFGTNYELSAAARAAISLTEFFAHVALTITHIAPGLPLGEIIAYEFMLGSLGHVARPTVEAWAARSELERKLLRSRARKLHEPTFQFDHDAVRSIYGAVPVWQPVKA